MWVMSSSLTEALSIEEKSVLYNTVRNNHHHRLLFQPLVWYWQLVFSKVFLTLVFHSLWFCDISFRYLLPFIYFTEMWLNRRERSDNWQPDTCLQSVERLKNLEIELSANTIAFIKCSLCFQVFLCWQSADTDR